MSWNNRVIWSEGMFIGTQHFQQHDRYLEALIDARSRPLSAAGWGFADLQLDMGLLAQGKLAIVSARGLLPDARRSISRRTTWRQSRWKSPRTCATA